MIFKRPFSYKPAENEREKAAYSYLMSLVAVIAGMPLPIVNFLATLIFFLGNRKSTYFVRWHCTQALLSQFALFVMNAIGFYWILSIIYGDSSVSNLLISYIITIFLFNLAEFIATVYTSVNANKGVHVEWWFYGPLTNLICKA